MSLSSRMPRGTGLSTGRYWPAALPPSMATGSSSSSSGDQACVQWRVVENYEVRGQLMKANEFFVDMVQFHIARILYMKDLTIQTAYDHIFEEIKKTGVMISRRGEEVEPTPEFKYTIRRHYVERELKRVLFTRLVTGFIIITLGYRLDDRPISRKKISSLREKDREKWGRVEAVPMSPPWGSYVISEEPMADGAVVYRLYRLKPDDQSLKLEKDAYVERVDGYENLTSRYKDCIGTALVPNRVLMGRLVDGDLEATKILNNPTMVNEPVPPPEKTQRGDILTNEDYNRYWGVATSMMDDTSERTDEQNERMRALWDRAQEEKEKIRIFERMLNDREFDESDISGAITSFVTQDRRNQIKLPDNHKLVHQLLPQVRSDLLEYIQRLQNQMQERLGYISNSAVIEKSGRSRQTDAKTLDGERRNAILQWTTVGSNALTAMYRFVYENPERFRAQAKATYLPRFLDATGVMSRSPTPETEVQLNYANTLGFNTLDVLRQQNLILPERFLYETLTQVGIVREKVDEIVKESRGKGLLKVVLPGEEAQAGPAPKAGGAKKAPAKGKKKGKGKDANKGSPATPKKKKAVEKADDKGKDKNVKKDKGVKNDKNEKEKGGKNDKNEKEKGDNKAAAKKKLGGEKERGGTKKRARTEKDDDSSDDDDDKKKKKKPSAKGSSRDGGKDKGTKKLSDDKDEDSEEEEESAAEKRERERKKKKKRKKLAES